ncbi:sphingosine kinase 1 [Nicotiana tabacum]|uniref:sphingosine kinase n=5 Tax=Nicotiana TaxID=4085 RepID=A0A1S4DM52_TOBAC|nr:PREDICTED: sphingosine kinase 1 isoform X1 [Nicotiana sylvestris]XP_016514254.1 PREDICTED: sphingosine kinase 1-like isoform X1 [Nicotiana tabacum]
MDPKDTGAPVLSDRVQINGIVVPLTLTAGGQLRWPDRCLSIEKDVLGFVVEGSRIKIKAVIESGAGICCAGDGGAPLRKTFTFEPLSEDSLRLWNQRLQAVLDSLGRPKKLFVLLNPYGGKRSASKIFLDDVKPLLDDANIHYTLQETKYRLHAKEVAHSLDLLSYDGVLCVSGDGILVEVVNGLLEREDWSSAIKMPLGVIPAGTSNGMAKSLLDSVGESCTAFNATLAIIRGHTRSLDVATVSQGQKRFFSVLMLAWGLVADIDIESEKYRWMGSARMDFYAIQRIFCLRRYHGCIKFLAAPGYENFGEPLELEGEINELNSNRVQQNCYCGPAFDMKGFNRKIEGPFVSIWLHNVPWGGENVLAAPDAKFADGYLDLVVMKDCSKLSLLALMSDLNKGGHVRSPHVLYLKVKAFVLEPGPRSDDPNKEGIIDADGEVLARGRGAYKSEQRTLMAYDKLHIEVDQGLATVFSPVC